MSRRLVRRLWSGVGLALWLTFHVVLVAYLLSEQHPETIPDERREVGP